MSRIERRYCLILHIWQGYLTMSYYFISDSIVCVLVTILVRTLCDVIIKKWNLISWTYLGDGSKTNKGESREVKEREAGEQGYGKQEGLTPPPLPPNSSANSPQPLQRPPHWQKAQKPGYFVPILNQFIAGFQCHAIQNRSK